MSDELGGIGAGGIQPTEQIGPIEGVPVTEELEDVGASTLSKSEKSAAEQLFDSAIPGLAQPWFIPTSFSELFSFGAQLDDSKKGISLGQLADFQESKAVISMLDAWLESIHEAKERRIEELNSPAFRAYLESQSPAFFAKVMKEKDETSIAMMRSAPEFLAFVNTLPPENRAQELNLNRQENLRLGLINSIDNYVERAKTDDSSRVALPFMVGSIVIAAGLLGTVTNIAQAPATELLEVNPLQEAWAHFTPIIAPNLQDAALLTINLFAVGVMYEATLNSIGGAAGKGEVPKDLDFARGFAQSVLKQVLGDEIGKQMAAMMTTQMERGEPVSAEKLAQLETVAKLVLLAMALALIYKVQTAWITGEEFAAMINGDMDLPEGEVETALVLTFRELLNSLPKEERAKYLEALLEYFDGNPDVEGLLNPSKAFQNVMTIVQNNEEQA